MALRNQPYFPLYVQDYLTDEKLNMCSLESQGVFIKIMCILHKSDEYGTILLKQKDKQNQSTCLNFAYKFARLLPIQVDLLKVAIAELVDENVLIIEGDRLIQKRMVHDNKISLIRSKVGKKGGEKTQSFLLKQKLKQNTEYENESEDETKDINIEFEKFWNLYDYKKNKPECEKLWNGIKKTKHNHIINNEARSLIMKQLPIYVKNSYKDDNYPGRMFPHTYLYQECWNDEVVENNKKTKREIIGYQYDCYHCGKSYKFEKSGTYRCTENDCQIEMKDKKIVGAKLDLIKTLYKEENNG